MGCQKLKTRRARFQQKQREPDQRGGALLLRTSRWGVSVLRSPETASERNPSRSCAGGQTVVHNKLPQPHTTTTIPRATKQARAFPSSCMDGSITRVGPGLNTPGNLWVAHSTALNRCTNEPNSPTCSGATVARERDRFVGCVYTKQKAPMRNSRRTYACQPITQGQEGTRK